MGNLDELLVQFKKAYGAGVVHTGSDTLTVKRIPTGIFPFDLATAGGFLRRRINVVYGPESSTKTTLALRAARMIQTTCWTCGRGFEDCGFLGGPTQKRAVFIDTEHAYDREWGANLGIDNDELVIFEPDTGEDAVDMLEGVLYAEDVGLVILDSVAALTPVKLIDNEADKGWVAGNAALVTKMIHKVTTALAKQSKRGFEPGVLFLNQVRDKI